MANISAVPAQLGPDSKELAEAILEALAKVRAAPVGELREEMAAAGGDLEIDSREAEAVIAMLEKKYGRTLAKVEDLEPECLASVDSLAELIRRRWGSGDPVAQTGSR
jgi:acyl carrier protein